jgi:pyruvate carboxylase subunit B
MKKEIKFSLVFRDMWQSAGKYVPRVDQLVKVAPAIVEMGCFARVETNGGGFEQVNLLFGENPNKAVREWTKPFHEAGIQTHMLDRALNGLRMSPVPADVRKLFYKVKKAQGTDITRTFCGLNDIRNIAPSITYAHEAGMISQCSLCITHSPIHTVEYYTDMALKLIKLGADEICIKDMAGIGRPVSLGKIVANIKAAHPDIPIQYHSHAGPGFNMASILAVCEAGCDYIDVGMEPLSWGTGHADLLSVQAMLKDAGFKVPEINMEAYMKVRALIQEFMDDFLGLYISPKNRLMNSLLIGPGLPGGHGGKPDGGPGIQSGIYQQVQGQTQPAVYEAGRTAYQTLQRSGIRMAARGLSTVGDSVQPVRQEPFHDERHGHGERKRTLGHDSRRYLGHAVRQGRQAAGRTRSRTC